MCSGYVPRYFFHLYDDIAVMDEEGVDLPDDHAARAIALQNAREMACAEVEEGRLVLEHRIDLVDESGRQVGAINFRTAVGLDPPTDR